MAKNCDSMQTVDRVRKAGKEGGKAGLCKPKGGSTEWYVTEEVNPIDKTCLSDKPARFANTKTKAAAQLVSEGAVPSFSSCAHAYINSWIKEANDNNLKTSFIRGKKRKQRAGFGSLSSLLKSLKALPQSMMRCTMNCLYNVAKQMH